VRDAAAKLRVRGGGSAAVPVTCAEPTLLGAKEQLEIVAEATLVVCENGSTGYAALLQRAGSSFISVVGGQATVAKEPQVLLYLADAQTFYLAVDDVSPGALLLALERAGARLGIPNLETVT
jgi:hypothetical protein